MGKGGFFMVVKQSKVEVTDRIIGKLKDGYMELYFDNEPIGKLELPQSGTLNIQLDPSFEVKGQKIYKQMATVEEPNMKYTDCDDETGWC